MSNKITEENNKIKEEDQKALPNLKSDKQLFARNYVKDSMKQKDFVGYKSLRS